MYSMFYITINVELFQKIEKFPIFVEVQHIHTNFLFWHVCGLFLEHAGNWNT
jgi:hypothetical protein